MIENSSKTYGTFQVLTLSILSLVLILLLGSLTSASVLNILQNYLPALYEWANEIGLDRITRRCYLIWAVVLLIIFLKHAGWQGIKDIGWKFQKEIDGEYHTPPYKLILAGLIFGSITMCTLLFISLHTRTHVIDTDWAERIFSGRCFKIFISGIAVGLFEETLCRGIFFRVLSRKWSFLGSALLTSLIFSLAHFASPSLSAFETQGILQQTKNIFLSTISGFNLQDRLVIHILNLTLLGTLFCLTVKLTGTIWLAAGTHISAIWIIKSFSFFTTYDPAGLKSLWQSPRTDMMDSLSATVLLLLLTCIFAALIYKNKHRMSVKIKIFSHIWHINRKSANETIQWIKAHTDVIFTTNRVDVKFFKSYQGCNVFLKDGMVVKEYYPTSFLQALRLSFKQLRAKKAFYITCLLEKLIMPVATAMGWCVIRKFFFLKKQYLLVREIENSIDLVDVLRKYADNHQKRKDILKSYGILAATFHKNNFSNRDMKYENIVCTIKDEKIKLWIIDMDGVSKKFYLTRYRAGRDLRRIGLCLKSIGFCEQSDIEAFFDGYNSILPPRLHRNHFPE